MERKTMKIFDCTIFFNEVNLLEIRLNVLSPYIDYFVIVQSTHTFTGNKKEVIDILNLPFIEPFKDRIKHFVIDTTPDIDPWENEIYQRNHIQTVLNELAEPDDIILISDLDEIPNLEHFNFNIKDNEIYYCKQLQYYYYFNLLQNQIWYGTNICRFKILDIYTPQNMRDFRNESFTFTIDSKKDGIEKYQYQFEGWHFSYLGTKEQIKYKLQSFCHTEYAKLQDWEIEYSIKLKSDLYQRSGFTYKVVGLDGMPDYILNNKEKYKQFILEEKR